MLRYATLHEGPNLDKIINLSVRLSCRIDQAFEMFTKDEQLETWLTEAADVEPEVGGKFELFWNPKDKENNHYENYNYYVI